MPRLQDDDLFQSSTMTFGEHLEELRTCLIRASAGLAVAVIVGFFVAQPVVRLIEEPQFVTTRPRSRCWRETRRFTLPAR